MSDDDYFGALPIGYQLEEYRIEAILGQGGFGITYKARDTNLNKLVAIKEYLPEQFAFRKQTDTISPRHGSAEDFYWGLERFLQEAQTLGQFEHPNIVPVLRYFSANETAYMVMAYQDGQALSDILDAVQILEESELEEIIYPLLGGLDAVHRAGVLHRDIKPENIFIRLIDGTPVLLDFGAARQAIGARQRNVTRIVTPNYAPHEQYHSDGELGPWTDIYALAAVIYEGITGAPPPEAPARITNDKIVPAARAGRDRYRRSFLQAIDAGLAVRHDRRPQTIAQWRKKFPEPLNPEIAAAPLRPGRLSGALRPGSARLAAAAAHSRRLSAGESPTARDPMAVVTAALADIGEPDAANAEQTPLAAAVRSASQAAPQSAPAAPPAPPLAARRGGDIETRPTKPHPASIERDADGRQDDRDATARAALADRGTGRRVTRASQRYRRMPLLWVASGAIVVIVGGFTALAIAMLSGAGQTNSGGATADGSDGGSVMATRNDTDPDPTASVDIDAVIRDLEAQADIKRRQAAAALARQHRQRELAAAKARDNAVTKAFHNRRLTVHLPGRGDPTLLRFASNGALSASTVSTNEDINENGRWWIKDSRLCLRLQRWNGGQASCFRLTFKGRPTGRRVDIVGASGAGNFSGTLTY